MLNWFLIALLRYEQSQSSKLLIGKAKIVDNDVSEILISKEICKGIEV